MVESALQETAIVSLLEPRLSLLVSLEILIVSIFKTQE